MGICSACRAPFPVPWALQSLNEFCQPYSHIEKPKTYVSDSFALSQSNGSFIFFFLLNFQILAKFQDIFYFDTLE